MKKEEPALVDVTAFPVMDFMICQAHLPIDLINNLNNELDNLLLDSERKSHSHTLVGQIKKGEQIHLLRENKIFQRIYRTAEQMGITYIELYGQVTGQREEIPWKKAICTECWSVHQFSGDYNPLHDHGVESLCGLSFILWTKVPKDMRNSEADTLFKASGMMDGCVKFVNGPVSQRGYAEFRQPKVLDVIPEIGRFVIFPHWLNHMVNPFYCEGERRSISGNVNLFKEDEADV